LAVTARQSSFAEAGFEKYRKKTPREQFLEEMDSAIWWQELIEVIEPYCIFQSKAATYSTPKLPPIPRQSCHPFHAKAATLNWGK